MQYQNFRRESNELYEERLELVMERIRQIAASTEIAEPYTPCFQEMAEHLVFIYALVQKGCKDAVALMTEEEGRAIQERLYAAMRPEVYAHSYLNPVYACERMGTAYGRIFSMLYAELTSFYPSLMEGRYQMLCLYAELFVELYNRMEDPETTPQTLRGDIRSFMRDNSELFHENRVMTMLDPDYDYCTSIVMGAELSEPAYLYRYGYPVTKKERRLAAYLEDCKQEEIREMAEAFTDGYRTAFETGRRDIRTKKTVQLRYPIGAERMARAAVSDFEEMGLRVTMSPYAASINRQFDYDHAQDRALWLDKAYVERSLESLRCILEREKIRAAGHAGTAVIRGGKEEPFLPEKNSVRLTYHNQQKKLAAYEEDTAGHMIDTYIYGENEAGQEDESNGTGRYCNGK